MGNKACKEICRIDLFSDPKRFQAELGNPKYSNKPLKDLTPSEAVSGAAHEVSKKASEAVTKGIEVCESSFLISSRLEKNGWRFV